MSIKFGIIGFGFMGQGHFDNFKSIDGIEVTAICDIDESQMKEAPDTVKKYTNSEDLVKDPNVDVVLISANNNQHLKLVKQAAAAGKDIICEKPVAMNVKELEEMEEAVNAAGVKFTVHQQRRFDPDYRSIKQVFDAQTIGDVYTIQSHLYGFNGNMHDWHIYPEQGGGMMYDWGVHLIDQILYMVPGKVVTVYADVRNVINKNVDDYFKIILRFDNNYTAEIELGTYFLRDEDNWFEHHWFLGGNKGTAYVDGFFPKGKIVTTTELLTNVSGKRTMTAAGPTRSFGPPKEGLIVSKDIPIAQTNHAMYFENYIRAYKGEEDFLVKIPEVKRVLRIMEAAWESAKTKRTVDFED